MVCKATGKKWSDFTVTTSVIDEHMCEHLNKLKDWKILVQCIHLNPAGKN